jgi:hypothetical protein
LNSNFKFCNWELKPLAIFNSNLLTTPHAEYCWKKLTIKFSSYLLQIGHGKSRGECKNKSNQNRKSPSANVTLCYFFETKFVHSICWIWNEMIINVVTVINGVTTINVIIKFVLASAFFKKKLQKFFHGKSWWLLKTLKCKSLYWLTANYSNSKKIGYY